MESATVAGGDRAAGTNHREAWLSRVLSSLHEGVLVIDRSGLVVEMNEAFTELLGYGMSDEPIRPPYPWWPTAQEDPVAAAAAAASDDRALGGAVGLGEFELRDADRRPVWVACADALLTDLDGETTAIVRTFRNITGEKRAQARRAEAARLSVDFTTADDLATLLSIGQRGFETLFDGGSTTQLVINPHPGKEQPATQAEGDDNLYLFAGHRRLTTDELPELVRVGLGGTISADAVSLRPGILLVPPSSTTTCRVWVQFVRPRRVRPDEMIVADLLAQLFGLAIDRILLAEKAAEDYGNLQQAIDAHRNIGQAIGILVERHRIQPGAAFDRLRKASQDRNVKLRELAARVVETGAEPEQA